MRRILVAVCLVFLCSVSAYGADIPNISGIWKWDGEKVTAWDTLIIEGDQFDDGKDIYDVMYESADGAISVLMGKKKALIYTIAKKDDSMLLVTKTGEEQKTYVKTTSDDVKYLRSPKNINNSSVHFLNF